MKKTKHKKLTSQKSTISHKTDKIPLGEHLRELKRRIFYVFIAVAIGSIIAYGLERRLIELLLKPSHGQQFIYTSPLGGLNFLFSVCLDLGLILATPVIIYNILAFLKPLMQHTTHKFLILSSVAATGVAIGGVAFGYFIGLPSALQVLLHQFVTIQVRPLLTIQSYISFVSMYLLASALMFQLPLIILLINRIKPLKPRTLLKYERHAIVGAIIIAFIMNPTPNLIDQMLVVIPVLAMYQLSIGLIWIVNRTESPELKRLRLADAERQSERLRIIGMQSKEQFIEVRERLLNVTPPPQLAIDINAQAGVPASPAAFRSRSDNYRQPAGSGAMPKKAGAKRQLVQ